MNVDNIKSKCKELYETYGYNNSLQTDIEISNYTDAIKDENEKAREMTAFENMKRKSFTRQVSSLINKIDTIIGQEYPIKAFSDEEIAYLIYYTINRDPYEYTGELNAPKIRKNRKYIDNLSKGKEYSNTVMLKPYVKKSLITNIIFNSNPANPFNFEPYIIKCRKLCRTGKSSMLSIINHLIKYNRIIYDTIYVEKLNIPFAIYEYGYLKYINDYIRTGLTFILETLLFYIFHVETQKKIKNLELFYISLKVNFESSIDNFINEKQKQFIMFRKHQYPIMMFPEAFIDDNFDYIESKLKAVKLNCTKEEIRSTLSDPANDIYDMAISIHKYNKMKQIKDEIINIHNFLLSEIDTTDFTECPTHNLNINANINDIDYKTLKVILTDNTKYTISKQSFYDKIESIKKYIDNLNSVENYYRKQSKNSVNTIYHMFWELYINKSKYNQFNLKGKEHVRTAHTILAHINLINDKDEAFSTIQEKCDLLFLEAKFRRGYFRQHSKIPEYKIYVQIYNLIFTHIIKAYTISYNIDCYTLIHNIINCALSTALKIGMCTTAYDK